MSGRCVPQFDLKNDTVNWFREAELDEAARSVFLGKAVLKCLW